MELRCRIGERVTDQLSSASVTAARTRSSSLTPTLTAGAGSGSDSATAFTPNGDGLNDLARPICVGIRKINYFTIYNRWGQIVFTTNQDRQGWNGIYNGMPQGSSVFVWVVSAEDYNGLQYFDKGTVTLIR